MKYSLNISELFDDNGLSCGLRIEISETTVPPRYCLMLAWQYNSMTVSGGCYEYITDQTFKAVDIVNLDAISLKRLAVLFMAGAVLRESLCSLSIIVEPTDTQQLKKVLTKKFQEILSEVAILFR